MIPSSLRAHTLAPVTHLPSRGRVERAAYLPVDAMVRPVEVDPADAPVVLVHRGQGRSHGRPIHLVGGRPFTPVLRYGVPGCGGWARPEPIPAAQALADLAAGPGRTTLAAERGAQPVVTGTPALPRAMPTDGRLRRPVFGPGQAGTIRDDGRDVAREALARFYAEDVRVCGDLLLVAMGGPLLHLDRDRKVFRASLNPALVDPHGDLDIPVFIPFFQVGDRYPELIREGIAKGPLFPLAPTIDHLDPNPADPPVDLVGLPLDRNLAGDMAARATALAAPAFALMLTRYAIGQLGPERSAGLRGIAAGVEADNAWTRLGHFGPRDAHAVLSDALRLVEATVAEAAYLVRWTGPSFSEQARRHALSRLVTEAPEADRDALSALAP